VILEFGKLNFMFGPMHNSKCLIALITRYIYFWKARSHEVRVVGLDFFTLALALGANALALVRRWLYRSFHSL
jgi:hypothetical protein